MSSLNDLKRKDLLQTKGYIDGEWVASSSSKTFNVVNPANLDTLATLPEMNASDTDKAIATLAKGQAWHH